MGTNDNRIITLARDCGNDGGLAPRVGKRLHGGVDSAYIGESLVDLPKKPCRALRTVFRLVVSGVE